MKGQPVIERENLPTIHQYARAEPKIYRRRESENQPPNTVVSGADQ
jgi:hypothetical protein